jgi:hypothetical protein
MLSKGTWRLDVTGIKNTTNAILTFDASFDNGTSWTSIGTRDSYNASQAIDSYNFTGIAVPTSGKALLRVRVLTRNASSTGWYMQLSTMDLVRTA